MMSQPQRKSGNGLPVPFATSYRHFLKNKQSLAASRDWPSLPLSQYLHFQQSPLLAKH
jgi:hypothetical protein